MRAKGIRILDKENNIVSVELSDIFSEIKDGNKLYLSILYLNTTGDLGIGQSIPDFEEKINKSEKGLAIT